MTEIHAPSLEDQIAGMIWDSTWNAPDKDDDDAAIPWAAALADPATADHFDDEIFRCRHLARRILAALSHSSEVPALVDQERAESVAGAVADYVGNRADLDAVFQVRGWYPEYGRDRCREVAELQRDLGATVAAIYQVSIPASDPPAARALTGEVAAPRETLERDTLNGEVGNG